VTRRLWAWWCQPEQLCLVTLGLVVQLAFGLLGYRPAPPPLHVHNPFATRNSGAPFDVPTQ
jgi:hypothetical protein